MKTSAGSVPTGFVLVPEVPTTHRDVYAAMLAAAPPAPIATEVGVSMTDDEARAALADCMAWISTSDSSSDPAWRAGTVGLDGNFTVAELRAILHFAPPPDGTT